MTDSKLKKLCKKTSCATKLQKTQCCVFQSDARSEKTHYRQREGIERTAVYIAANSIRNFFVQSTLISSASVNVVAESIAVRFALVLQRSSATSSGYLSNVCNRLQ
ncbi:MAG: hypothetical protein WCS73_12905 [Lentisphaeria bacterium]